jgi:hypothetical protein
MVGLPRLEEDWMERTLICGVDDSGSDDSARR